MSELSEFEGKQVTEVGIEIRNVAGGLQDAVKFQPVEWPQGTEHFIVLRCLVKNIDHEPVDKEDYAGDQRRVHVLTAAEAFPIAASVVEKAVEEKRAEIKKLKDETEGTPALDLEGNGDLPIGADDFEGDEDEKLRRAEYDAALKEGKSPEDARAQAWGDAKEPVHA